MSMGESSLADPRCAMCIDTGAAYCGECGSAVASAAEGRALAAADRNAALTEDRIASAFHEAYERLAPRFDYKTRERSAVPWEDVPEDNKRLMRATVRDLLDKGVIRP